MKWFHSSEQFLAHGKKLSPLAYKLESFAKEAGAVPGSCFICNSNVDFKVLPRESSDWIDLRGGFICSKCNQPSRLRFLYEVLLNVETLRASEVVIFERVTSFYNILKSYYPKLKGVEFMGPQASPGEVVDFKGKKVQHEDMMSTSFASNIFDLVVHSDVLEHVPSYKDALAECLRILRPGGSMVFACPVYNFHDNQICAEMQSDGNINYLTEASYHGNPLSSEGSLVYTKHGYELMDDLRICGFSDVKIAFEFSLCDGYVSNNNPYYDLGHMWPVVLCAKKPVHCANSGPS